MKKAKLIITLETPTFPLLEGDNVEEWEQATKELLERMLTQARVYSMFNRLEVKHEIV